MVEARRCKNGIRETAVLYQESYTLTEDLISWGHETLSACFPRIDVVIATTMMDRNLDDMTSKQVDQWLFHVADDNEPMCLPGTLIRNWPTMWLIIFSRQIVRDVRLQVYAKSCTRGTRCPHGYQIRLCWTSNRLSVIIANDFWLCQSCRQ